MNAVFTLHRFCARVFIEHCRSKLGWSDLSQHLIMDVGCGGQVHCGRAILEKFPEVETILAIDKSPVVVQEVRSEDPTEKRIICFKADIEERFSIQHCFVSLDKIVSTRCFQEVIDKREAFENMYHMLKFGGQAAIKFAKYPNMITWAAQKLGKPEWDEVFQEDFDMRYGVLKASDYVEMAEEIGFQVIDCQEWCEDVSHFAEDAFNEKLSTYARRLLKMPEKSMAEIRKDSINNLIKTRDGNKTGQICKMTTDISLLLVRPMGINYYVIKWIGDH